VLYYINLIYKTLRETELWGLAGEWRVTQQRRLIICIISQILQIVKSRKIRWSSHPAFTGKWQMCSPTKWWS